VSTFTALHTRTFPCCLSTFSYPQNKNIGPKTLAPHCCTQMIHISSSISHQPFHHFFFSDSPSIPLCLPGSGENLFLRFTPLPEHNLPKIHLIHIGQSSFKKKGSYGESEFATERKTAFARLGQSPLYLPGEAQRHPAHNA